MDTKVQTVSEGFADMSTNVKAAYQELVASHALAIEAYETERQVLLSDAKKSSKRIAELEAENKKQKKMIKMELASDDVLIDEFWQH